MQTTKYSYVKKIIEENPHLKNEELAKKIGRSISWVKAFKAFMNSKNKYKYKNSSNPVYRAIFNAWMQDIQARKEYEENELCKFELEEKEKEIQKLKKELSDLKKQFYSLKKDFSDLEEMKKDELIKLANKLCNESQNKLKEKIKELENELHRVYSNEYWEKQEIKHKLKVTLIIVFSIFLGIFFALYFFKK